MDAEICGGAAFAALEQFFRAYAVAAGAPDIPQFEIMKRLLEQQTDQTEVLTVKTTFLGTRENSSDTGDISGISIANFYPAALIRGTLNGMAKEPYNFYRVLNKRAGISRRKLVAAGSGVRRNAALPHILSNMFDLPPHGRAERGGSRFWRCDQLVRHDHVRFFGAMVGTKQFPNTLVSEWDV